MKRHIFGLAALLVAIAGPLAASADLDYGPVIPRSSVPAVVMAQFNRCGKFSADSYYFMVSEGDMMQSRGHLRFRRIKAPKESLVQGMMYTLVSDEFRERRDNEWSPWIHEDGVEATVPVTLRPDGSTYQMCVVNQVKTIPPG